MKPAISRLLTIAAAFVLLCMFGFLTPASVWHDSGVLHADQRGTRGLSLECPASGPSDRTFWFIILDDYGYADWLEYTFEEYVPSHEMLSGEWAAAIRYDDIGTEYDKAMWLTDQFICPDWTTNSTFWATTPMEYPDPSDKSKVHSVISNGVVEIDIKATMYGDCRTQLGFSCFSEPAGAFFKSDNCVMVQDYTIKNMMDAPISNLTFYQFLHGHPTDHYGPGVWACYDPMSHPWGICPDFPDIYGYVYEITQYYHRAYVDVDYYELIGFGAVDEPSAYDVWHYSGDCLDPRPEDGLHVRVENNSLTNISSWGPDETAGAEMWDLGILGPDEDITVRVLLSVAAEPEVIWVDGAFEPEPAYIYYKYAFNPMTGTVYAGNFDDPYTAEDVASADVNGIPATIVGVLESYPGFDGSVVELEIPIAPFLDDFGAPLDTVEAFFNIKGQFADSEQFAGVAKVELIGKSSASGGKQWILPPDEILLHGDVNASGDIDIDDVVRIISVIFSDGQVAGPFMIADCNCSHSVDIDDAIYLIEHIFASGPFPCHD